MKFPCDKHGCHFEDQFEEAYECGYWADRFGLATMPKEKQKQIWDAIVTINPDEILNKYNLVPMLSFYCYPMPEKVLTYTNKSLQCCTNGREIKALMEKRINRSKTKLMRKFWNWYYIKTGYLEWGKYVQNDGNGVAIL